MITHIRKNVIRTRTSNTECIGNWINESSGQKAIIGCEKQGYCIFNGYYRGKKMQQCKNCGYENGDTNKYCAKCGSLIRENQGNEGEPEKIYQIQPMIMAKNIFRSQGKRIIRCLSVVLAIIVVIECYDISYTVKLYGNMMSDIESVGGQTLEEAYYQYSGSIYVLIGRLIKVLGWFFAVVLIWLGFNFKFEDKAKL